MDDVGEWWPADRTWWGDASNLSIKAREGGCFCERNGAQQARRMDRVMAAQLNGLATLLRARAAPVQEEP